MTRPPGTFRLEFKTFVLPLLQALLTGVSTALGVLLVTLWRPKRTRYIPFYSDATHNDPERVVLAIGENIACFFMPLVALAEYIQQSRLAQSHPRPSAPRLVRCFLPINRFSTRTIVLANFLVTTVTTPFFFITANVPSKYPYTKPHQVAASALILVYALQATLKAILAQTFFNYEFKEDPDPETGEDLHNNEQNETQVEDARLIEPHGHRKPIAGRVQPSLLLWWGRHHMKLRLFLAVALWLSLVATWLCFVGRVTLRGWGMQYEPVRGMLSVAMAVIVHVATVSCVVLMGMMAVDMRHERLVLFGRAA